MPLLLSPRALLLSNRHSDCVRLAEALQSTMVIATRVPSTTTTRCCFHMMVYHCMSCNLSVKSIKAKWKNDTKPVGVERNQIPESKPPLCCGETVKRGFQAENWAPLKVAREVDDLTIEGFLCKRAHS